MAGQYAVDEGVRFVVVESVLIGRDSFCLWWHRSALNQSCVNMYHSFVTIVFF